jgi:hypothetical protein
MVRDSDYLLGIDVLGEDDHVDRRILKLDAPTVLFGATIAAAAVLGYFTIKLFDASDLGAAAVRGRVR